MPRSSCTASPFRRGPLRCALLLTLAFAPASLPAQLPAANSAPVAHNDAYAVDAGETLNIAASGVLANDTDADGDVLTAQLVQGPPNGSLNLGADGGFTYAPAAGFSGSDSFTYRAFDGTLASAPAAVTITVRAPADTPPTIHLNGDASVTLPQGQAFDDPGATATDAQDGDLTGRIEVSGNIDVSTPGVYTLTYSVTDSAGNRASVSRTVTVVDVNARPRARDDRYETEEDEPLTVSSSSGVLVNDTDADGDALVAELVRPPSHGDLSLEPNGAFRYAPDLGFAGRDRFDYRVNDGTEVSASATVTIIVHERDEPPTVDSIPPQTATESVPYSLDLATFVTDVDTPRADWTFALVGGLPSGLRLAADGRIFGVPALVDSVGEHKVRFSVSDAASKVEASFRLTVLEAGRTDLSITISAAPNPALAGASAKWVLTVTNRADAEGDVEAYALDGRFRADQDFVFDAVDNPGCTLTPSGGETTLHCTLGALAGGAAATVELSGTGTLPGNVLLSATVGVEGPVPIDETPDNDSASSVLSIAEQVGGEPAQKVGGIDARSVAAGDLNGDGFIDLALSTGPGEAVALFNVPDPQNARKRSLASTPVILDEAGLINAVTVVDVDGDDDADIVLAAAAGAENGVLINAGSGVFAPSSLGGGELETRGVAAGDVDGDAFVDLVFANAGAGTVLRNLGSGVAFAPPIVLAGLDATAVVLADLFGDTRPELVFAKTGGDSDIYQAAAGGFEKVLTLPTGTATSVTAADFDGDGALDLAFGRNALNDLETLPASTVALNRSASAPAFADPLPIAAGATIGLLAADVNLDGKTDLVAVNASGAHQVFTNTGNADALFALHPVQIAAANVLAGAAASLSADQRIDVVLAGSDGISVLYNDGAGSLGQGDIEPPMITLLGDASITLDVNDTYTDPGATASDAVDGDLTAAIEADIPVNTEIVGTYTVSYNVTDSSGNWADTVTRTVQVGARQGTGGGGGGAMGVPVLLLLLAFASLRREPRRSSHLFVSSANARRWHAACKAPRRIA